MPTAETKRFNRSAGLSESFATFELTDKSDLQATLDKCRAFAEDAGATLAKVHLFYPKNLREEAQRACATADMPVMWTESDDNTGQTGGAFVHAVKADHQHPLVLNGRPVGLVYRDEHAEYCLITGVHGEQGSPADQTLQVFEALEALLAEAQMDYSHVLRTWFYNKDILAWYGDFNRVRTQFYNKHKVFENLLPASTGIGADNPHNAALVASAFAVRALSDKCVRREVASPMQCPATDYGSSFARAVLFDTPEHRRLTISGTASIAPGGETTHVGDFPKQFDLTHEVIEAILKSENFGWEDVVRGIAYFRHAKDAQQATQMPLPGDFPVIRALNVVCRDDLLYELEINAVQKK